MFASYLQVSTKEALDGKHVAFYLSSQAVEDQLEKAAAQGPGQEAVRPTPVVKEVSFPTPPDRFVVWGVVYVLVCVYLKVFFFFLIGKQNTNMFTSRAERREWLSPCCTRWQRQVSEAARHGTFSKTGCMQQSIRSSAWIDILYRAVGAARPAGLVLFLPRLCVLSRVGGIGGP